MSSEDLEKWRRQQAHHLRQVSKYSNLLKKHRKSQLADVVPILNPSQSTIKSDDDEEIKFNENILSPCIADSVHEIIELNLPKNEEASSLHKKRIFCDIDITVTKREFHIEKQVVGDQIAEMQQADWSHIGPPQTNVTWNALSKIVSLTVSYAIPAHRLAKMLGNKFGAFSSGQITRLMRRVAELCVPIYLELADQLSEVSCLHGDDSPTKVIELAKDQKTEQPEDSLILQVSKRLGYRALKADGSAFKKRLSISVVAGQTDLKDQRSWIFFFRSHFGDLGNLLSRILQTRRRKNKVVKIQSDLAAVNHLEKTITDLFNVFYAGCGSHARRDFWRHRTEDPGFCYFMLRGFALLARVETRLKENKANAEEIVKTRQRYSAKLWAILLNKCKQAMGESVVPDGSEPPYRWPPGSPLYQAANYVVKNYEKLTTYLNQADIFFTNNLSERLLRREKMMLVSSKFRKTEQGRVVFDILQTLTTTCTAAHVELAQYLPYLWKNHRNLTENPHLYTPFAFAQSLQECKKDQAA